MPSQPMARRFYIVDVFAERPYAGNQLAVVVGADDLSDDTMQRIAAETNYSETTFVNSAREHDDGYRVRIFTPAREIAFAGHPILGTAWVVHHHVAPEAVRAGAVESRRRAGSRHIRCSRRWRRSGVVSRAARGNWRHVRAGADRGSSWSIAGGHRNSGPSATVLRWNHRRPLSYPCAVSTRFGGAGLTSRRSLHWPPKASHRWSIFSAARLTILPTISARGFSSRPMACAKTRRRGMERHSSAHTCWSIDYFRIPIWTCGSSKDTRSVGPPW